VSQWTHVSGCIRFDGLPQMGIVADLKKIMGEPSGPYDAEPYFDGRNIPGGSEGTIQYAATKAGDGLVWMTVAVWGDLRDFGLKDTPEIDAWFDRIAQAPPPVMLRSAHLLVEVEYGGRYVLIAEGDGKPVRRVELPMEIPA
jgi:hypothetical protein